MMENGGHINLAMAEEAETNGMARSKVATAVDQKTLPCGSTVSFHNIQYKVQLTSGYLCNNKSSPKEILFDLNGIMKPGLNAILGPTGSGKSSFLDVLASRKDPSGLSGEILIDKAPKPPNFKWLSGYVVQDDDVVMGTLTVRENLCFSAALRLPSSVRQSEKEARVSQIIQELGLTKVADSKVGSPLRRGISGGERKRTNIGMELIIDPPVLFLDEPTTGLDSSTANSVLLLLKKISSHGRTIIMSIHQPRYSIYRLFDCLTLLDAGKMVYHGPAANTFDYFTNIGYLCEPHNNPADFFLDVINGNAKNTTMNKDYGSKDLDFEELIGSRESIRENLVEEYRNSSYCCDTRAELQRIIQEKKCISYSTKTFTYNSSFFHQLRWVLKRTFQNLLLNPETSVAQVVVSVMLAIVVGVIFFSVKDDQSGLQNRLGVLFFIIVNQCFNTVSAAELFISERRLFVHEYITGYYRVSVYFISKTLTDVVLRSITSVNLCCIVYFMIGLKHTAAAFFLFTLTMTMTTCTASAMAMAISADQDFVSLANIYMTVTFILMMIFSGLLVNLPNMSRWLSWLQYFSIPRYGYNALLITELVGLKFCDEAMIQNTNRTVSLICTGEQYLDYQRIEYSTWGLWENIVALAIMMFIFLYIGYLKLRYIRKFT